MEMHSPLPKSLQSPRLRERIADYSDERSFAADLETGRIRYEAMPDSRARMDTVLEWTNEFNRLHVETDWGQTEYLDAVDAFYEEKVRPLIQECAAKAK